jgi:uncharacterized membrane protein YjgN (DUF898 family)
MIVIPIVTMTIALGLVIPWVRIRHHLKVFLHVNLESDVIEAITYEDALLRRDASEVETSD